MSNGKKPKKKSAKKKKAKQEVKGSPLKPFLERFKEVMDDAHDSIYFLDSTGKFTFLNKKGLEKLGFKNLSEIEGKDFREVLDPKDIEKTVNNFLKRLKGEFIPPYEITIIKTDGTTEPIEVVGTPWIENGKIVGEWGIARDLTERKRMEEEIAKREYALEQEIEARERQAQVYERNIEIFMRNSNDAIVITDPERNISSWNRGAEEIYGYKAEDVIGRPITVTIPPELHIEFQEVLGEVERRGYIRNYETERITKHGKRITPSATVSVILCRT